MRLSALTLSLALLFLPIGVLADEMKLPDALKDATPQQLMGVGFGVMKFNESEKEQFGKIIGKFSHDVQAAVTAEARRNLPNAPRRIKRRLHNLFKDLDNRVKPVVTKERWQGYLIFKKGLAEQMEPKRP